MASGPDQTAPAYVRKVTILPDNVLGIQTGTFEAEFSRPMDTTINPLITFALPSNETWVTKADMPTARYGLSVVTANNGKIYAIGGIPGANVVEEYNPATDTWATRAPMPTSRFVMGVAAASNGKIYVVGGENGALTTNEEYDPATDTWATRAPMPTGRDTLGLAAASNGKLYAIGGKNKDQEFLDTVEEYDPATDSWVTRTSMPTARGYLGVATASNGKIYAIGGVASGGTLVTVEEYDPVTDTWTRKADMPTARFALSVAATNDGKIYAIGGANGVPTVEEYDTATNTWTTKASLHKGRFFLGAATGSNGKIYAIGGEGQAIFDVNEEFTPAGIGTQPITGSPAWVDPTHFRASYDFTSLNSKGSYSLSVTGGQTTDGMMIAPNTATTFTVDYAGSISDKTPPNPSLVPAGTAV